MIPRKRHNSLVTWSAGASTIPRTTTMRFHKHMLKVVTAITETFKNILIGSTLAGVINSPLVIFVLYPRELASWDLGPIRTG